jgi:hypothetical protein
MRVSSRIYHQGTHASARALDPINDSALAVGLKCIHLDAEFAPELLQGTIDIGEPRAAINLGFPMARRRLRPAGRPLCPSWPSLAALNPTELRLSSNLFAPINNSPQLWNSPQH